MQHWGEPRNDRGCKPWRSGATIWLRQVGLYHFYLVWCTIWSSAIPGQSQNQSFQEKPNIVDVACGLELPKNSADEDNHNCFWHFFVGWHQISSSKSTSKSDLSISIWLISELRALETPALIHRLGFSILPWQFHARRMLQVITRYVQFFKVGKISLLYNLVKKA